MFLNFYNSRLFINVDNRNKLFIDKKIKKYQKSRCEYIHED